MSHANEPKLRHLLLHRIGRHYRVICKTVEVGRLRFAFTRILDPDRVLDEVAAQADLRDRLHGSAAPGDELHLPYWAELWESARGLGEYLVTRPNLREMDTASTERTAEFPNAPAIDFPRDCRPSLSTLYSELSTYSVLDLGCGMGMAGTVAAALGANVVFADLEPPALLFARLNSLPWRRRVQTRRLNWQRDTIGRRFDLILGADILYERAQWPFLEAFWRAHLACGGEVLLGEPGRQTGEMFIEWIAARGWRLVMTEVPITSRPRPIRILCLRREAEARRQ